MPWAAAAAVVGAAVASKSASNQRKAAEAMNDKQIEANTVDPRITEMLFGSGTQRLNPGVTPTWSAPDEFGAQTSTNPQSDYTSDTGLLGKYTDALSKPQDWALGNYANNARNYITDNAGDMGTIRSGALQQMGGFQAPQMDTPLITGVPLAQAARIDPADLVRAKDDKGVSVKAPSAMGYSNVQGPKQNEMDLSSAFERMINATPGGNPYLTEKINGDMAQSKNYFDQMQSDSSRNLSEMILPTVRGGAIASGQYGGSRQGIAEGRAMGDFAREQQRAITMFGQNNTNAAAAARSAAYESDSNRSLSAMQGLSAQQNQAAITNANNAAAAAAATYQGQLQTNLLNAQLAQTDRNNMFQLAGANAGFTQQTNLANQNALLGIGQNNQQAQLGTNSGNLQSLLGTNTLNSQNLQNGMANLGGLLNSNFGTAAAQDQYGLNQLGNGLGVLAPYLAKNATPTQLQPVYNNSGAAALGGAISGAQIGGQIGGLFGGSGQTANPKLDGAKNGYGTGAAAGGGGTFYDGYGWGS